MHERKRPGEGDISGPARGDVSAGGDSFRDWDNPEDSVYDDTPEGYYDDESGDDGGYIPGPGDPDYDLSEVHGYADWEAPQRSTLVPQWVIVAVSLLMIVAILIPVVLRVS